MCPSPHPLCKMSPARPVFKQHLLPNQNNFFSTYFHKKKIPKKKGWSPKLKLSKKQRKTTAKNLSCLFFPSKQKKNSNWPSDFSLSLSFTTLLLSYCSVFSNMHTFALHMWSRNNFFHPKQFVHQCLGFSHLKRKTTKKNNKKQTDHPPVFTAICAINCKNVPF